MRTSVRLEGPVVARPIEDVFTFLSDLENSPRWGRTKKTSKHPDSPDGVGGRYREEARILGEKVNHESELSTLEPPNGFSYINRFENGAIERTRITLETVEAGTRIDMAAEVEIEQIPQVLAPFVAMVIRQRMGRLAAKLEQVFAPSSSSVMGAATMIAIGAILLATVGLGYLVEILPEGAWSKVVALSAVSLIAGGAAIILWKISRGSSDDLSTRAAPRP